jgi:hypothetical protein
VCESPSAEPGASRTSGEVRAIKRERGRQKLVVIGAVAAFVLAVVVVVLSSWPDTCERAARRVCDAAWTGDCDSLRALIKAHADVELCSAQLEVLGEIERLPTGELPRSYLYGAVIKTLIGEDRYAELQATAQPPAAD